MPIPARALALGIMLVAAFASPASAADEPKTRLVSCAEGSCLLVTGRRADVTSNVMVNGHAVSVQGGREWRAILPVAIVREWSAPYARTITISVGNDRTGESEAAKADLPIGLLGHAENLAMLVVRAK